MVRRLYSDIQEGGIQNKFYIANKSKDNLKIYEVMGNWRIGHNIHPSDLIVDICMYNLSKNEAHRYNEYLGTLLDNERATAEERSLISEKLLSKAKQLPKSKEEPYIPF